MTPQASRAFSYSCPNRGRATVQMFFLDPSIHCAPNDELAVDFEMRRKEKNHRLMHVRMQHRVEGPSPLAQGAALRTSLFNIE